MLKLNIQKFGGRGASSIAKTRSGFGMLSKDGIPVYNGKIDYTGDFTGADVSKMSDKQLREALDTQNEIYMEALNENLGDQRTRNGRMNKIFNESKKLKAENGMNVIVKEMDKRNLPRYNIYSKDNKNMVLVSAPTKKIAERQLNSMIKTDRALQKTYNWSKLPEYVIKKGKKM